MPRRSAWPATDATSSSSSTKPTYCALLFDQLRLLLNQKRDSASTIIVVLLGQPDLAHKLRFAPDGAPYQRIAIRYQLPPFDLEETAGTIKRHPRVAGFPIPDTILAIPSSCTP